MSRRAVVSAVLALVSAGGLAACKKASSSKTPEGAPAAKGGSPDGTAARGAPEGGGPGAPGGAVAGGGAPATGGPDDQYQLETAAVTGAPGAEAVARVVIHPAKGFHMNKDYPTKLTVELPAGVTTGKTVLEKADAETFDDNQLAFAVKLTAAAAGDYSIPATLRFAVCTESTCNPKKQTIALALKAQ